LGDILTKSLNNSIKEGSFPPTQRQSYLRLLPKEGKDVTNLKNWRPITLSNCDYKLLTKILSNRLLKVITDKLSSTQTAYIKGRQITDNIRLARSASKLCKGYLVMLDAQKAFDSLNHDYIRAVLKAHGLGKFVDTFNTLYRDQKVDVLLGGDVCGSYNIMNGVKQGDSLSCILFIMCIDPLIKRIECNKSIKRVITKCETYVPKVLAYADDLTCLVQDPKSIRQIFKEYEKFSQASGLYLNADKTEILTLSDTIGGVISVKYCESDYNIQTETMGKLNGVYISADIHTERVRNFEKIKASLIAQLQIWKSRGLTLLGRILIAKTFGLSQLNYTLTCMVLESKHMKELERIINCYLWKRPFDYKAPRSRINNKAIYCPIKRGGFGMIKIEEVALGIRCRQLLRLTNPLYDHPLAGLTVEVGECVQLARNLKVCADDVAKVAHTYLKERLHNRLLKLDDLTLYGNVRVLEILSFVNLEDLCRPAGIGSASYNKLKFVHNVNCLGDLLNVTLNMKTGLSGLIKIGWLRIINKLKEIWTQRTNDFESEIYFNNKWTPKMAWRVTSGELRRDFETNKDYTTNKIVPEIEGNVAKKYFVTIKNLTSVRHKNIALRVWNGDIMSRNRLVHMGLVEDSKCQHCGGIETQKHMIMECTRATELWERIRQKAPEGGERDWLNLPITETELTLECLWHLLNNKDLDSQAIYHRSTAFLNSLKEFINTGQGDINISLLI
ncbi:MAG: hypothetical protein FJ333_08245, partial [Sphingomonadales bacterium]|nr:hypothetical protein [Sphingomonadales bacterium]